MSYTFLIVILWFIWIIFCTLISGWFILVLFLGNIKNKLNTFEIFAYSISLGTIYISILGLILDGTIGINLLNIIFPTIILIIISSIVRRKNILEQLSLKNLNLSQKGIIIIFLVVSFGLILRVIVPIFNEILMAKDPWYWLNVSKNVAFFGHSFEPSRPLYPSGFAYIVGILCLIYPELTYSFIQIGVSSLYFIVGCLSVISISNRILGQNKTYSFFAGLIFASSYLLVSFGMLGLPQNVAYALIPSCIYFFSKRGWNRLPGILLTIGIYIIHSPSALLILISLGLYGLYYLVSNRKIIYQIETKIILTILLISSIVFIILILTVYKGILNYFIQFFQNSFSSSYPNIFDYFFFSSGLLTLILTIIGGVYSYKSKINLSSLFFIIFVISFILSFLPYGTLGVPWPPLRYLMYMSTAATIPASLGMERTIMLIKKYDIYNFKNYLVPIFVIGVLLFQAIIGLTAFAGKGGWETIIDDNEYSSLNQISTITNYSDRIIVYPGILPAARGYLNPRIVITNSTYIYNETAINQTILNELIFTEYNYILVNSDLNPILFSLLELNLNYTKVYSLVNIHIYQL